MPAFPGATFSGRVILDLQRRGPGNAHREGSHRSPKPGRPTETGHVCQCARSSPTCISTAISIPQSAVLDDGGKTVVFVADGNGYKKRQVTAGHTKRRSS